MKKEIADKWVKKLRSGEYKQGREFLKTTDGEFCCLGVLCEIYRAETKQGEWVNVSSGPEFYINGVTESERLPILVTCWAGMYSGLGDYSPLDKSLAAQNDSGTTFAEIANIIEKQWQSL